MGLTSQFKDNFYSINLSLYNIQKFMIKVSTEYLGRLNKIFEKAKLISKTLSAEEIDPQILQKYIDEMMEPQLEHPQNYECLIELDESSTPLKVIFSCFGDKDKSKKTIEKYKNLMNKRLENFVKNKKSTFDFPLPIDRKKLPQELIKKVLKKCKKINPN